MPTSRLRPPLLPTAADGFVARIRGPGSGEADLGEPALETLLVEAGHAELVGEASIDIVGPGALVWLGPRRERAIVRPSAEFAGWRACYRLDLARRAAPSAWLALAGNEDPDAPDPAPLEWTSTLPLSDARELAAVFSQLALTEDLGARNDGLAYALGRARELHRAALARPRPTPGLHPAVEQATRLLGTSTRRLGRAELAGLCGLSESQLSRLFKQQVGVSLAEYRNRERLRRFVELYGDGSEQTLVRAALDAGFGSYPQFHRVFKQMMGVGPSEYARQRQLSIRPRGA